MGLKFADYLRPIKECSIRLETAQRALERKMRGKQLDKKEQHGLKNK